MKKEQSGRERMVFETTELRKRAVKMRGGMDNVRPAQVINNALDIYLAGEIDQLKRMVQQEAAGKKLEKQPA